MKSVLLFIVILIKVSPLHMLKTIHLLTGVSALLLSLILASNKDAALLLASFALANLLIAPVLPTWHVVVAANYRVSSQY